MSFRAKRKIYIILSTNIIETFPYGDENLGFQNIYKAINLSK